MSFYFFIESLKFYKLKNANIAKLFFFSIFIFNFIFLILPIGDRNLLPFLTVILEAPQSRFLFSNFDDLHLSNGNLIFLASRLILVVINFYFALMYTTVYSSEADGLNAKFGIKLALRAGAKYLLFSIVSILIFSLSSFLLLIPFIFFISTFIFAPLFFTEHKEKFIKSFKSSIEYTYGNKSTIIFSLILCLIFSSWLDRVFYIFAGDNLISFSLISALVNTIRTLVFARLVALLYLYFTKFFPKMQSSFAYRDPRTMVKDIEAGKAPRLDNSFYAEQEKMEREIKNLFPELYLRIKNAEEMRKKSKKIDVDNQDENSQDNDNGDGLSKKIEQAICQSEKSNLENTCDDFQIENQVENEVKELTDEESKNKIENENKADAEADVEVDTEIKTEIEVKNKTKEDIK